MMWLSVGMDIRQLGTTGVKVSQLCLGTMMFGAWGNTDHDDCARILQRAVDAGINFVDTADMYSFGESEVVVGKALKTVNRDSIVLATKFHNGMSADPNAQGNSRRWAIQACEDSLRRLDVDYLDIYQVHRPSPGTDIDDTLGALSDLVHQGKIRYAGCSTFPAHQIVESQWVSERRNFERFRTEQPQYSLLYRGIEADVLPVCEQFGMGVLSWSPLAGGWLSGAFGHGKENVSRRSAMLPERYDLSLPGNQRNFEAVVALQALADELGHSLIELALAFVASHPAVTAPIIGPRTMEQLESHLASTDVVLSDDVLDRIDAICPPGENVGGGDDGWQPPSVGDARLRRRSR